MRLHKSCFYIYIYVHACMCMCIHIYIYIHVYKFMYNIYIYICMCVHIYRYRQICLSVHIKAPNLDPFPEATFETQGRMARHSQALQNKEAFKCCKPSHKNQLPKP